MYTNSRIIRSRRTLWALLFAWPLLALLGPLVGRHFNMCVDNGLGLRARINEAARAAEILEDEAVDQRVDRRRFERTRRDTAAAITEPALELRGDLRLQRGFAGDDDSNLFCVGG